jgi:hypothetical protein
MKIGAGFSTGRIAYNHNMRIGTLSQNVDPERVKDNIIFVDKLKGRTIEEFINKGMQKWIDEYNEGKKPCRQIKTNYTDWHKSQKRYQQGGDIDFAYEAVLSYGGMDDIGKMYEDPNTKQKIYDESKELFKKWIKDLEEQYKHLKVIYAVAHYDEKTPHLHICYMPVASDYQRGLKRQICISRALEQDGIEKIQDTKTALEAGGFQLTRFYKKFRNEVMNPDLVKLGYELKEEKTGKKHIDSSIYAEVMQEVDERIEKAKELESFKDDIQQIERHEREIIHGKTKEQMIKKTIPARFGKEECVVVSAADFNSLHTVTEIEKTKRLIESTKKKIEAEHKRQANIMEVGVNQELKAENENLKYQILDRENDIRNLQKQLSEKQSVIDDQKTVIKYLLYLIRDEVPKLLERAKDIVKSIFKKEQEQEKEFTR